MKVNKRQYLGLQARRTATFNYLGTAHSRVQEKPEIRPTRDTAAGHEALLRLINVAAGYGQARVLHNVNLDIRPGGAIADIRHQRCRQDNACECDYRFRIPHRR